ncbi:MAG: hypothetical protein GY811_30810 [Myxococcales bacterium]|nr:hypothetical protein [Myxococcales bacterium]
MKTTALFLSLSLFSIPACSKKKDKADTSQTAAKTVQVPSVEGAAKVPAAKTNPALEALATKFDGLEEQLEKLDYKSKAFEKELIAAYGPLTTTLKAEQDTRYWIQCDSERCVGASMTLADDPAEVDRLDPIDEQRPDSYYYGFAYLAWRSANPDAKTSTTMTPKQLSELGNTLDEADEMLWDAAIKRLKPAGASTKYPEDEELHYWHAIDSKSCVSLSFLKYMDGEAGPEIDSVEVLEFEAFADPLENYEYARCAMYALGLAGR